MMTAPGCLNAGLLGTREVAQVTISSEGYATSTADLTVFTFSSMALGTAATGRKIAVTIFGEDGTTGRTISTVTIGGVSAAEVVAADFAGGSDTLMSAIWAADVPTGTTGDVVVTWSAQTDTCAARTFKLTNAGTVAETLTDITPSSNALSVSPSAVTKGATLALASGFRAAARTWAYTNLANESGTTVPTTNFFIESGWEDEAPGDIVTATASFTCTEASMALAVWNPA